VYIVLPFVHRAAMCTSCCHVYIVLPCVHRAAMCASCCHLNVVPFVHIVRCSIVSVHRIIRWTFKLIALVGLPRLQILTLRELITSCVAKKPIISCAVSYFTSGEPIQTATCQLNMAFGLITLGGWPDTYNHLLLNTELSHLTWPV